MSRHSPEQLYQPFLQVLLGSIQVIQVGKHLLVILLPVRHLLAELTVILLGFGRSFFKLSLGPGGGVVSLPADSRLPASPVPQAIPSL